ncbi:sulfatase-like hydrolase/transferase [Clostridium sp. AM58-1XD]|uniref:sulfatase-like hydrolase/transferase n=1 Tax=Clostridium sp. AM58-1XD TaxID=2292307 RepID=UPI00325BBCC3
MRAIILMYDSLVKNMLQPYGCEWTRTPNFQRLAEHTLKFENCYVGSLPCMPARREMHTGRYNFFTRSWGPLEPFDDSLPENLMKNGIHTHLISDHYHYWEEGGANYHTHFGTWEIVRGQEGDKWKANLKDPSIPKEVIARPTHRWRQDWVNRGYMDCEEKQPQTVTWGLALDFLKENSDCDNWMLQIECSILMNPFLPSRSIKIYILMIIRARFLTGRLTGRFRRMIRTAPENIYAASMRRCFPCATGIWVNCWIGWMRKICGMTQC